MLNRIERSMHRTGFLTSGRSGRAPSGWRETAWLLIACFLLQPVLAYLVTPLVVQDTTGRSVVMCTLQGSKLVTLDLPPHTDEGDTGHCPALRLYQIASSVSVAQPPLPPTLELYVVAVLDQRAAQQHHPLYCSAYSTRAPPIV